MKLKDTKKNQKTEKKSFNNLETNIEQHNDLFEDDKNEVISRFDLEQSLLGLWHIVDDLNLLYEYILERDVSKDELANMILGMKLIYNMKHDKCMDIFEVCAKNRQIL